MNGGRASTVAQDVYRAVCQNRSTAFPAAGNRAGGLPEAEEFVRGSLKKVRSADFEKPLLFPERTRRQLCPRNPRGLYANQRVRNGDVDPRESDALLTRDVLAAALSASGFPIRPKTLSTLASRPGKAGGPPFRHSERVCSIAGPMPSPGPREAHACSPQHVGSRRTARPLGSNRPDAATPAGIASTRCIRRCDLSGGIGKPLHRRDPRICHCAMRSGRGGRVA